MANYFNNLSHEEKIQILNKGIDEGKTFEQIISEFNKNKEDEFQSTYLRSGGNTYQGDMMQNTGNRVSISYNDGPYNISLKGGGGSAYIPINKNIGIGMGISKTNGDVKNTETGVMVDHINQTNISPFFQAMRKLGPIGLSATVSLERGESGKSILDPSFNVTYRKTFQGDETIPTYDPESNTVMLPTVTKEGEYKMDRDSYDRILAASKGFYTTKLDKENGLEHDINARTQLFNSILEDNLGKYMFSKDLIESGNPSKTINKYRTIYGKEGYDGLSNKLYGNAPMSSLFQIMNSDSQLTDAQKAGVAANAYKESKFDNIPQKNGPANGFYQMEKPMWEEYNKSPKDSNKTELENQTRFVLDHYDKSNTIYETLKNKLGSTVDKVINMNNDEFKKFKDTKTYKKYKSGFNSVRNYHVSNETADSLWNNNNAEDAAKAFMYKLEKPKHDSGNERAEYAKKFLDLYNLVYPK